MPRVSGDRLMPSFQDIIVGKIHPGHVDSSIAVTKAQLERLHTVGELSSYVQSRHQDCSECASYGVKWQFRPFVRVNGVDYEHNVPLVQDELPGSAFTQPHTLHFVLDLDLDRPPKRCHSPVDALHSPKTEYEQFDSRGLGETMPPWLRLGTGDISIDMRMPGTVLLDTSSTINNFQSGVLLKSDAKLCLLFATQSPYMVARVTSLLRVFHDLRARDDYSSVGATLGLAGSASGPACSPSAHHILEINFTTWPAPVAPIPDNPSAVPEVPETGPETKRQLDLILNQALSAFAFAYPEQAILEAVHAGVGNWQLFLVGLYTSAAISSKFRDLPSPSQRELQRLKPEIKLWITVVGLSNVFDRPALASAWHRCPHWHPAIESRRCLLSIVLLRPLFDLLAKDTSILRKVLFAGSALPTWLLEGSSFPNETVQVLDLSKEETLHGFSRDDALAALGVAEKDRDLASQCIGAARTGSTSCDIVAPECAISIAERIGGVRPAPGKLDSMIRLGASTACAPYVEANFERAAAWLYPLLVSDSEVLLLAGRMATDQAFGPPMPVTGLDFARLRLEILLSGDSMQRFAARCLLLGLVRPSAAEPTGSQVNGEAARFILKRIHAEAKDPKARYQHRPMSLYDKMAQKSVKKVTAKVKQKPMPLDLDDLKSLNAENLSADELARIFLKFYRGVLYSHPLHLPVNEHELQANALHIFRAAQLELDDEHASNVQDEFSLRTVDGMRKRGDGVRLRRRADGTWLLEIFEFKYHGPESTARATNARVPALKSYTQNRKKAVRVKEHQQFIGQLLAIDDLPSGWSKGETKSATGSSNALLSIEDVCSDANKATKANEGTAGGVDVPDELIEALHHEASGVSTGNPGSAREAVDPAASAPSRTDNAAGVTVPVESVMAVAVASDVGDQVRRYRDCVVQGIQDELCGAPGLNDWRFTNMGEGVTTVVPYCLFIVAGALAFAQRFEPKVLPCQVGIVGTYPWHDNRTRREVETLLAAKTAWDLREATK